MKNLFQSMSVAAVVGAVLCGRCETVAFSPHASDPDNVITNDVHYAKPIAEITKTDEVRYWGEYNSITINVPLDVPISPAFQCRGDFRCAGERSNDDCGEHKANYSKS